MASNERTINRSTIGVEVNSSGSSKVHIENVHMISKEFDFDFDLPEPIQHFTARNEEFIQLDSLFFNEDTTKIQNKVVICGIPGIGKSEFAVQFADKYQKAGKINNVYRIKAEQESELKKSWLQIKEIYKTSEKRRTLFILDNGVSRKKLRECEFKMPNDYFFVITSQIKDWGDDIVPIKLSTLDLGSSVEFYKKKLEGKYNNNDCELLKELANFVGCIPLGLQITAAGVREYNKIYGKNCVEKYIEDLKTSEMNIIVEGFPSSSNNAYDKSLYTAIQISLNKIDADMKEESGPLNTNITLDVLYISSYLDPEWGLYGALKWILENNKKYVNCKKNMLDKALITLDNFSLVTLLNRQLTMHRFTQEIIRYHFRTCYLDKVKEFYESCLENAIGNLATFNMGWEFVLYSILQHVDVAIEPIVIHSFKKCLSKVLVPEIRNACTFIFNSLIKWGHTEIIQKIYNNSDLLAEVYIIQYYLLLGAREYNQTGVAELLQNYFDKNTNNRIKIELALEFYKHRLKEIYKDNNRATLEQLTNLVGCVALSLEITAAGVRQYAKIYGENCVKQYLDDLKESLNNIIGEGFQSFSDRTYFKLLYGAINISFKEY